MKLTTSELCTIGIMTAIITGVSQLMIPLAGGVPITLQTFIIALAGALLGAKKGAAAAFIYVLLGAIGLPVFAGFTGGFQRLIGPNGGFILSFPIMAFVIGLGAQKGRRTVLALALFFGSAINLSMGMLQFALITGNSLQTAFFVAMAPFIPIEAAKMAAVFIVSLHLKNRIKLGQKHEISTDF